MHGCVRSIALGLVILTACSSEPATRTAALSGSPSPVDRGVATQLPALPASILPGYVVRTTTLDPATVAADALNPPSLETLLTGAGFQTGVERRFTARGKRLTEVVGRVLRFRSAAGATTYVAWVAAHGTDLLGTRARPTAPPELPGAVAFRHGISGCCTKDTYQYLAAWTRGPYAVTLLVAGPDAGRGAASPIAAELDARVRKEG